VEKAWSPFCVEVKNRGKTKMYIEQKSVEELQALIKEKGYFSGEAEIISSEIEYSKRKYGELIRRQEQMPGWDKEAESVVKYYLFQLQKLKYAFPYDAMGCETTVPLLILGEFKKEDIAEKIKEYIGAKEKLDGGKLKGEIQKFITVQLDPRGIVLYMDILNHCKNHRKYYMKV